MAEGAVGGLDGETTGCRSDQSLSLIFVKQRDTSEKADDLTGIFEDPTNARRSVSLNNRWIIQPQPFPVFRRVRALPKPQIECADAFTIRELRLPHFSGRACFRG